MTDWASDTCSLFSVTLRPLVPKVRCAVASAGGLGASRVSGSVSRAGPRMGLTDVFPEATGLRNRGPRLWKRCRGWRERLLWAGAPTTLTLPCREDLLSPPCRLWGGVRCLGAQGLNVGEQGFKPRSHSGSSPVQAMPSTLREVGRWVGDGHGQGDARGR